LQALGAWLRQNGEAIYGTHPWKRATGETREGIAVRFTQKESALYATVLGQPKTKTITLKAVSPKPGSAIFLLGGDARPLAWSQKGEDVQIDLPAVLPGRYAYVLSIQEPVS
jgi:alpha-L-fucosidase